MSGHWDDPKFPKSGWICTDIYDLYEEDDDATQICEMCQSKEIRHVHVMDHRQTGLILECGHICAGHMKGSTERAKHRERQVRNRQARRKRWLTRKWNVSWKGNHYLRTRGYVITIYQHKSGAWKVAIRPNATDKTTFGRKSFDTIESAKLAGLDGLEWMESNEHQNNGYTFPNFHMKVR